MGASTAAMFCRRVGSLNLSVCTRYSPFCGGLPSSGDTFSKLPEPLYFDIYDTRERLMGGAVGYGDK